MLIDFGAGSRQLFTATVNQTVTHGLPTTRALADKILLDKLSISFAT
jgi:hypothetical protein